MREELILSELVSSILRKEYWPSRGSNQRPPVLNSDTLQTELRASATIRRNLCLPATVRCNIWREDTMIIIVSTKKRDPACFSCKMSVS